MPGAANAHAFLTTPPGRGGIAVIALTGPGAAQIVGQVFRPWKSHMEDHFWTLRLGHIVDGPTVLDEVVLCKVPGDGEGEFYEINIHGGPLVARQTMDLLQRCGAEINREINRDGPHLFRINGVRPYLFPPAHPRWNNPAVGREMLDALPQAQSELVVSALTNQWSSGISQLARDLLPFIRHSSFDIRHSSDVLHKAAGALRTFDKLLTPPDVVVLGPPNAGKSTLVNAMVGRAVSIVHEQPGTTRDWVRELALINGVPVFLTDTAGLWERSSDVDAQAMRRARAAALDADLVLLTAAGEAVQPPDWLAGKVVLRLAAKCDTYIPAGKFDVAVSAHTEQGMAQLKDAILCALDLAEIDPAAAMAFTRRQADLLAGAAENQDRAEELLRELLGA
jgi:tRNA modification GTPase